MEIRTDQRPNQGCQISAVSSSLAPEGRLFFLSLFFIAPALRYDSKKLGANRAFKKPDSRGFELREFILEEDPRRAKIRWPGQRLSRRSRQLSKLESQPRSEEVSGASE